MVAAENGNIFDLEGYGAVGMSGNSPFVLKKKETIPMPHGSELMLLPQRKPIVYNIANDTFEILEQNPFNTDEKIFPVAVFNSPGHVNRHFCAYDDEGINDLLPLFSYGAVGFGKNNFRSATLLVDKEPRQDLRQMPKKNIVKGVKQMQKKYPYNRLIRHLENCALQYGCPAGKNFFLKRYEARFPHPWYVMLIVLVVSLYKLKTICAPARIESALLQLLKRLPRYPLSIFPMLKRLLSVLARGARENP